MANGPFARLIKILTGAVTGAENELNRLERFALFWTLVGKNFARNRCPARAAALSYSTLLALIPMLAVAVSVTSSLLKSEGEQEIYHAIDKLVSSVMPPAKLNATNAANVSLELGPNFSVALKPTNSLTAAVSTNLIAAAETNAVVSTDGHESGRVVDAQKQAARRIHEFIQNTRGKTLGVIGMAMLVYVAIMMLANIEATFNDIWGVARGRNWLLRVVLYWAAITLGPLLLIVAGGLAGGAHLQAAKQFISQTPLAGGLIFKLLPPAVLWLTFAVFYQIVPNTKVKFSAALVGGLVGGTLWHLNNVFGFLYVSRVVSNSKIYGSLGLVPVFMIGLYFSWLILLFGAQVAYAFQNRKVYLQDKLAENVNQRGREFIALRLMTCLAQKFQNARPPATIQEISAELNIPTKLAQQILQTLLAARLIVETNGRETAYAPARPLDAITAHDVLRALRGGGPDWQLRDTPAPAEVYGEFARIEAAERAAASSVTLLALVHRAPAALAIAAPGENQISGATEKSGAEKPAKKIDAEEKIGGLIPIPPKTKPAEFFTPDENRDFPLD